MRCSNKPVVIAEERYPGKDGEHGSMSLCAECHKMFLKAKPADYARFTSIDPERVAEMRGLFEKWIALDKEAEKARSAAMQAARNLEYVVASYFHIKHYECKIGVHECKDSPIGLCVYDEDDDPSWDDCLICHGPHERK